MKLLISVLALSVYVYASTQSSRGAQPNILWVVAEDMSADLGCYGHPLVKSPTLDKLAIEGMRFDQVHVTAPACSPSRTALATGVFQTTLGAHHMRYPAQLKPQLETPYLTLPTLLKKKGYTTANLKALGGTGKDDWQFKCSDKEWDTSTLAKAVAHQPFFAQIQLSRTHRPFSPYEANAIEESKVKLPPYYPDHVVARKDWAQYLSDISVVDNQMKKILSVLKQQKLDENTIVIFFADHGRPMLRGKNWLYDSGIHIPLIIYIPERIIKPGRYKAGSSNKQLISSIDIVAQTVHLAGGDIPEWMQGRPFLDGKSVNRDAVFSAIDRVGGIESCSRSVRTKRYKYIRNFKSPGSIASCSTAYRRSNHPTYHLLYALDKLSRLTEPQKQLLKPLVDEELYDLKRDPYEINNLIGDTEFKDVHSQLRKRLIDWQKITKDKGLLEDGELLKEHFIKYGESTDKERLGGIEKLKRSVNMAVINK